MVKGMWSILIKVIIVLKFSFTCLEYQFNIIFQIFRYNCKFLFSCTGYYSYETPYKPAFPGEENFKGTIIHPQKWTEKHDKEIIGKKVALIGSGATAITILPNIADVVSHVTMVQRTPTFIGNLLYCLDCRLNFCKHGKKIGFDNFTRIRNNLPDIVSIKWTKSQLK